MIYRILILFLILCIPIIYFQAEHENSKPQITYYELVDPEPIINDTVFNASEQNLSIPVNETELIANNSEQEQVVITNNTQINKTINETQFFAPVLLKKGSLNEQNSKTYANVVYNINQMRNTLIFYTDSECYLRINPYLEEKDWESLIVSMNIPLHYKFTDKYCKLLQSTF